MTYVLLNCVTLCTIELNYMCFEIVVYPSLIFLSLSVSDFSEGKGKADHARMGVGGVLISLTLAVSP